MRSILASTLLISALCSSPAAAATLAGPATVVDGDTLEIDGKRIRLFGIDAPETSQVCYREGEPWACGEASADWLRRQIGNNPLSCTGAEVDIYGRLLAVCTLDGIDLNRAMVAEGWAIAFRLYSDRYVADEARARGGKLGLWTSNFVSPEEHRAAEREAATPAVRPSRSARAAPTQSSASVSECLIKGNRNRRGEWIYHLPGMPYYNETRAEEMFCTEAEAVAAGYRRSRAG
jgi:endonuclease YncB( thermonuclease family)